MTTKLVDEIDVIAKSAIWLAQQGWKLAAFSLPKGQRMSIKEQEEYLTKTLKNDVCEPEEWRFISEGPDIIAERDEVLLRVECKGLGSGKPSTLRNNFDRALASVVSYYDRTDNIHLGLSFPDAPDYVRLLSNRVPDALRITLNIWIFLLSEGGQDVRAFPPEKSFRLKERETFTPEIIAQIAERKGMSIEETKAFLREEGFI